MDITRGPVAVGSLDAVEVEAAASSSALPVTSITVERLGESLVLPSEHRLSGERLAIIASLAGVGAIVLGGVAMATTLRSAAPRGPILGTRAPTVAAGRAADVQGARSSTAAAVSFLANPSTRRIPFSGSGGRIVLAVDPRGSGVLVLEGGFAQAPTDASYVAWLIDRKGRVVGSAAVFSGRDRIVRLSRLVPLGAAVAVTLERGATRAGPTSKLRLVARRNAA